MLITPSCSLGAQGTAAMGTLSGLSCGSIPIAEVGVAASSKRQRSRIFGDAIT